MYQTLRSKLLEESPDFRRFVALIALATAIPMLGVPMTRLAFPHSAAMLSIAGLMTFLGGPAHVSLTAWLYADPDVRPHLLDHKIRYLWAPIVLVVGTTAAYAYWGEAAPTRWINLYFSAWLLWHYQRQNWGILSFVTRVSSGESASTLEQAIVRIAVVAGFAGAIRAVGFGHGTIVADYADIFFMGGAATTLVLPLLVGYAVLTNAKLRAAPLRLGFLVVCAGFFLPAFLWANSEMAFLSYALAHGLQYFVFMSYLAGAAAAGGNEFGASTATVPVEAQEQRAGLRPAALPQSRPGMPMLWICVATVGVLLALTGDVALLKEWNVYPLFGLSLGLTMAHFVIDAGIWRLRDEFPRRYVGAAFPFLAAAMRKKG